MAAFARALAINPDHDRALYGTALSLISTRRLEEALAPLKRNTQLQPMSPYGWYQLARVQHELGRSDETQKVLDHLAKFEPKVARQLERETGLRARHAVLRGRRAGAGGGGVAPAGPGYCDGRKVAILAANRAAPKRGRKNNKIRARSRQRIPVVHGQSVRRELPCS